MTTEKPGIL